MANCNKARNCKHSYIKSSANWIPLFIVAILPKCPFCIMAYSGAMTLCSGTTLYPNVGGSAPYIILGISLFTVLSLAYNYKGRNTRVAIVITIIGITTLISSQYYFMTEATYYLGIGIMFFGIWYNGSFHHFFNKLKKSKSKINLETKKI